MNPDADTAHTQPKKPVAAFVVATSFGVGYLPKGPGTFGSLAGCLLTLVSVVVWQALAFSVLRSVDWMQGHSRLSVDFWLQLLPFILFSFLIALVGVWSASRVASYAKIEDPQYVVIDEISGQHLTYLLGLTPFFLSRSAFNNPDFIGYGTIFMVRLFNWKCLLLGFILFRLFDIWKPFPARQLERLPGGWGIMADDWMAAIYAAIVLQVALHFRVI